MHSCMAFPPLFTPLSLHNLNQTCSSSHRAISGKCLRHLQFHKHGGYHDWGTCMWLSSVAVGMQGPFLAGYTAVESEPRSYGIQRLDHAVGNVHDLEKAVNYIARATGFHEFAEFTAEVRHFPRASKTSDALCTANPFISGCYAEMSFIAAQPGPSLSSGAIPGSQERPPASATGSPSSCTLARLAVFDRFSGQCLAAYTMRHAVCAAQDVGTVDSGLNSMVLASNNEMVLLPVNEPTFGTRRKSQIQVLLCSLHDPALYILQMLTSQVAHQGCMVSVQ